MPVIDVENVSKSFGAIQALEDVSYVVEQGEIFGLLGPNGAGKTTNIRIILDIFKPDRGRVAVLGGPMNEAKKARIGYMPEERGLYQDVPLERCLLYLGALKGLDAAEARRRLDLYLERFELTEYRRKKVKELSKGMQQKAQIIATLLHQPTLVIIDEPFSGLDPVNTLMVKDLLRELRQTGATIVMSTHQMNQVEELCDRILLIHQGRSVLYGHLEEIRRDFATHAVLVRLRGDLPELPGVERVESHNASWRLSLTAGTTPQQILRALVEQNVPIEQFEIALPTLEEIFVRVVQGDRAPALE